MRPRRLVCQRLFDEIVSLLCAGSSSRVHARISSNKLALETVSGWELLSAQATRPGLLQVSKALLTLQPKQGNWQPGRSAHNNTNLNAAFYCYSTSSTIRTVIQ
jgi:hypothetical protein